MAKDTKDKEFFPIPLEDGLKPTEAKTFFKTKGVFPYPSKNLLKEKKAKGGLVRFKKQYQMHNGKF